MKSFFIFLFIFISIPLVLAEEANDPLRRKALKGDLYAMVSLGDEFFQGSKRPRNLSLAAFWYRKAAAGGLALGKYRYGVCLEFGWGTAKAPRLAFEHYMEAQSLGAAQMRVAEMLLKGVPAGKDLPAIVPDREKAAHILRGLCKANYYPAFMKLARTLYEFPKTRRSHGDEIYRLVLQSSNADKPAPGVLTFQARLLQEGVGVKPDMVFARALLEIAARQKDPEAEFMFAECLEFGRGCPVNKEKAFQYYTSSAKAAFPAALVRMGDYHLEGQFLPHDPEKAFKLFQQAADKKSPPALCKLGWCCENGIGTPKDLRRAFSFYERSADLGDPRGCYHAGRFLSNGIGVTADPAGAFFFFRRSAALGDREGMLALSECFRTGRGCTPDEAMSRRLKDEAARM